MSHFSRSERLKPASDNSEILHSNELAPGVADRTTNFSDDYNSSAPNPILSESSLHHNYFANPSVEENTNTIENYLDMSQNPTNYYNEFAHQNELAAENLPNMAHQRYDNSYTVSNFQLPESYSHQHIFWNSSYEHDRGDMTHMSMKPSVDDTSFDNDHAVEKSPCGDGKHSHLNESTAEKFPESSHRRGDGSFEVLDPNVCESFSHQHGSFDVINEMNSKSTDHAPVKSILEERFLDLCSDLNELTAEILPEYSHRSIDNSSIVPDCTLPEMFLPQYDTLDTINEQNSFDTTHRPVISTTEDGFWNFNHSSVSLTQDNSEYSLSNQLTSESFQSRALQDYGNGLEIPNNVLHESYLDQNRFPITDNKGNINDTFQLSVTKSEDIGPYGFASSDSGILSRNFPNQSYDFSGTIAYGGLSQSYFQQNNSSMQHEEGNICDTDDISFRNKNYLKLNESNPIQENPTDFNYCRKEVTALKNPTVYTNIKLYLCSICGMEFSEKSFLEVHLITHKEKTCICYVCGKGFYSKGNLKRHASIHTNNKPCTCTVCGKGFSSKCNLKRHTSIHTNDKPYTCTVCGKGFSSKGKLKRHTSIHANDKRYTCTDCGKGFKSKDGLKQHTFVHFKEKPYTCTVCGKGFSFKCNLKLHTSVHANEKPYMCTVCGKGFSNSTKLKYHTVTHTKQVLYMCDICGEEYACKSNLKRHLVVHTQEKPFICAVCGASFKRKNDLKKHMTVQHSEEKPCTCTT